MLLMGTFEHSIELEQFLAVLENGSISRRLFLVAPMETDPPSLQDCGSPPDRYSRGIEAGMAVATASSVIGTSVGFVLAWGPILCGIAAAFIGFVVGFVIYRFTEKGNRPRPEKLPEITIIVQCPDDQADRIAAAMWHYRALSVGRVPNPDNTVAQV
jgi:hypothetical protein